MCPCVGCEVSAWWGAVLQVATHWLLCEDSLAEKLYSRVESVPPLLAQEPLSCAVLAGYQVRRAALTGEPHPSLLCLCHSASQQLRNSLTVDACHKPDNKVLVSSEVSYSFIWINSLYLSCTYTVGECGETERGTDNGAGEMNQVPVLHCSCIALSSIGAILLQCNISGLIQHPDIKTLPFPCFLLLCQIRTVSS